MNGLQKKLFELLTSIVKNDSVGNLRVEDSVSVLNLAYQYKIITVIYNYVADDRAKAVFTKTMVQSNVINVNQQAELKRIVDYAEKNNIFLLTLKGFCIGKFYPSKGFREMCDIDLFYKIQQKDAVEKMMRELGYTFSERKENHETWVIKERNVFVELHFSIADVSNYFLNRIFEHKLNYENCNNIFRMSDEDLYVYLIIHFHHHLKNGTFSFRQLLDIFIMKENVSLDYELVDKLLNEAELSVFNENITKALGYIFGDIYYEEIADFAEYLLGNIAFGNNAIAKIALDSKGKVGFARRRLFPQKEKFLIEYPNYDEKKILMPVGYLKRIVHILKDKKDDAFYQYQLLKRIDGKMIINGKEQKRFLENYGVKSDR